MRKCDMIVAVVMLVAAVIFGRLATAGPDGKKPAGPTSPPRIVVVPGTSDPAPPAVDPQARRDWPPVPDANGAPVVQIAILLDTSNSMDGLIDQARTQLWRIVNELGRAKRDGKTPQLQVALYEYGKSALPREQGFLRMIAPFTTDLDRLSEELFALKTQGGEEYCGQVLRDAVRDLSWRTTSSSDLRMIFIAGNEPFSQGTVDYRGVCRDAAEKGIVVNTIFCGSQAEGSATGWADGAALGGGQYLAIDQNHQLAYVEAPQDKEIRALSEQLNQTYIPYGAEGESAQKRQTAQDCAAGSVSKEALLQRSCAKASVSYRNANWDLCDAVKDGNVKASAVKTEALPTALRNLPVGERDAYVERKIKERQELQQRIRTLSLEREKFLAGRAKGSQGTLQSALLEAIHAQAQRKGYRFE